MKSPVDHSVIGQKFNSWTVIGIANFNGRRARVFCKCVCGHESEVSFVTLKNGTSKSCRKCSSTIHGKARTEEYKLWLRIKCRCNNISIEPYGGRGIKMFPEWENNLSIFTEYIKNNLGSRPSLNHSIDRIDNNRGYEPGNIRWATDKQQSNNRRSNRIITILGESLSVAQWAEKYGLDRHTVLRRLELGWSEVDAVTKPKRGAKNVVG